MCFKALAPVVHFVAVAILESSLNDDFIPKVIFLDCLWRVKSVTQQDCENLMHVEVCI